MLGRGAFSCARDEGWAGAFSCAIGRGAFSCARERGLFHVLGRGAFSCARDGGFFMC